MKSWTARGGGIHGPVVHRGDLKRTFAIHDTPWTQAPVIEGLVQLYRRSGREAWLRDALRLADAQSARILPDGRYRWAGHEDDRFSSLVHNALADCALLSVIEVLGEGEEPARRERYQRSVETNVETYLFGQLYRPRLGGFRMNPVDYYAGRDRFVVNMNSLAAELLVRLDALRGESRHEAILRTLGERILALQCTRGRARGAFAYSDLQPNTFPTLYTALTLRGLPHLAARIGDPAYRRAARLALEHLGTMEDPHSRLWWHELEGERLRRFPIFVAGAGIVAGGILAAASLGATDPGPLALTSRLLPYQLPNGAFQNFVGYDTPDNARRRGRGAPCWEDVFPTPSWNAHAFEYLCRSVDPPDPYRAPARGRVLRVTRRFVYAENRSAALVLGYGSRRSSFAGLFVKRRLHAAVLDPRGLASALRRRRQDRRRSSSGDGSASGSKRGPADRR